LPIPPSTFSAMDSKVTSRASNAHVDRPRRANPSQRSGRACWSPARRRTETTASPWGPRSVRLGDRRAPRPEGEQREPPDRGSVMLGSGPSLDDVRHLCSQR
jgi:hypothetical protein